ncbi:MAG: metallophosphoesterase [Gemmatimonadota bacterium]|nr:metallophosphoesterase [Gemmatimonadota bacterium]
MRCLRAGLIALAVLAVAVLAWGALEPRVWLDEREIEAGVANLPAGWEDEEVAVIADLQVGMWLSNDRMAGRIVRRIVERNPRAVLVAGDFVYHPEKDLAEQIALLEELFAPLAGAGIPVYGVLGNHDWSISDRKKRDAEPAIARKVREGLEGIGVTVLQNERANLDLGGERLELIGLDSHWAGRDRVEEAFAGLSPDAPRVVLMHHPDSFESIPAGQAPFAVAAHTHGGQLRIPLLPQWSWLTFVVDDEVHADGWIEAGFGEAGNRLYVNRGIGFSRLPLRIHSPPELTFVRLGRTPGR